MSRISTERSHHKHTRSLKSALNTLRPEDAIARLEEMDKLYKKINKTQGNSGETSAVSVNPQTGAVGETGSTLR